MSPVSEQLNRRPRITAFVLLSIFFILVTLTIVVFAWLFNIVQETRLERAREDLEAEGAEIDEADLQKQYPTIEIF